MAQTKDTLRYEVAREVGFRMGVDSGSFRKDDLNQLLRAVGGDYVGAEEVYAHDSPGKAEFYQRLADAVGFSYSFEGESPRPLRRDELEQVLSGVRSDE